MKTEISKRKQFQNNKSAIAPIIYLIVIGLFAVGGISAYAYFTAPDITYNVAEGGFFNVAGVEISSLELVAIAMAVVVAIILIFKFGTKKE